MFYKTDEKWKSGVELNEYQDKFSIDAAYENKAGEVKKRFMFRIEKDGTAGKMMPVRVDLGDKATAIKALKYLLSELGVNLDVPGTDDLDAPF